MPSVTRRPTFRIGQWRIEEDAKELLSTMEPVAFAATRWIWSAPGPGTNLYNLGMVTKRVVAAIFGVLVCSASGDDDPMYRSPPIAKDGGVAVIAVDEIRDRLAYAVKGAEHSARLTVDIEASVTPMDKNGNGVLLYRFLDFDPVWDDVGEQLSGDAHFKTYCFQGGWNNRPIMAEVASAEVFQKDAIKPHFEIKLDGPSRKARAIRLKGRLEVTETKTKILTIHNFAKTPKNKVSDADLVDIAIEYELENGKDSCEMTMASSGRTDRFLHWCLIRNGEEWRPQKGSEGVGKYPDPWESYEQQYLEHMPADVDLELTIAVPVDRHVLPVDLKEIELP